MTNAKVLLSVHMYPPHHLAGGEMYIHNMAKMLQKMGCTVRTYMHRYWGSPNEASVYNFDGIDVFPPTSDAVKNELFAWADVIVCHLDFAKYSIWKAKSLGKPCIFLVHNTSHFYDDAINGNDNTFVIYNAQHAKDELQYTRPSMVMEPQLGSCISEDAGREYITLINLCENKGVRQFYEIARRLPNKKFLGVIGSYMDQETDCPPNVTIWPKQVDIRRVYEKTRILLMPSDYESFGMTAAEALANGIPVICSPTPGLKENCKEGAQYCDRDNIKKWVSLINNLDDPKVYNKWSQAGLTRTSARPERFTELEQFINESILQCQTGRAVRA